MAAGTPVTTSAHPKAMWPGVKTWWGQNYNEFPVEYTDLFDSQTSNKKYEEMVQLVGPGLAAQKPEGKGILYAGRQQGFVTRATHVTYALGYIVTMEELRYNQYAEVSRSYAADNAFAMRSTKETVASLFYDNAFDNTYALGDGVSLINASHPNVSGGTWSNLISADISELALEDINISIMGAENDAGLPINLMPRSLIVPRSLWYEANRILGSVLQNDTANNAVNVLKATNAYPEGIKLNHYLTDQDAFFVRTNLRTGGLTHFQSIPIMFDQDNDFDTKNARASAVEAYSFTCGDPRAIWGSAGV